jgi:hypothetical protein
MDNQTQQRMVEQLTGELTKLEAEAKEWRNVAHKLQSRLDGVMETNHFMSLVTGFRTGRHCMPCGDAIQSAVETMAECSEHFKAQFEAQQAEAQANKERELRSTAEESTVVPFPAGEAIAMTAAEKKANEGITPGKPAAKKAADAKGGH